MIASPLSSVAQHQHPFPYSIYDNAFDAQTVAQASAEFPAPEWPDWFRYNSPLENKFAYNTPAGMGPACRSLLSELLRLRSDLIPDESLHGGGLHAMGRGGKLDMHLDCDRHPHTGWLRRVNAILYVNPDWQEEWGGELEFWSADMSRCEVKIAPVFNRLVLFDTNSISYHGVPEPLRCPEGVMRKSLAVYYWSEQPGESQRPRARFVARPNDSKDPALEALREARKNRAM